MIRLKSLLTFLFFLSGTAAIGQNTVSKIEDHSFIEVTGIAEKEVVPDEIFIEIIIRERYVNRNKVTIEEQEEKLKTAIKSLGVDLANLSLSDANADYVKIRWQRKEVLTKKDFTLKVTNATTVGQVFMELEKLDITEGAVARVNHSKMDSIRKEVKILAIKAAKDKADYLLTAIGEKTGKPLIIKENEIAPNANLSNVNIKGARSDGTQYYINGVKMQATKTLDNEIEFQKIKVQSSIYAKFLIK